MEFLKKDLRPAQFLELGRLLAEGLKKEDVEALQRFLDGLFEKQPILEYIEKSTRSKSSPREISEEPSPLRSQLARPTIPQSDQRPLPAHRRLWLLPVEH